MPAPALFLAATTLFSACSLMAPSDAELLGGGKAHAGNSVGGGGGKGGTALTPGPEDPGGGPAESDGGSAPAPPAESSGQGGGGDPAGGAPSEGFTAAISGDGLRLWLMGDRGIGPEGAGAVAIWADHSSHEADAKQSLSSLQPQLVQSADGTPPMLEFDGVDDQLALPSGFDDFSDGLSVFIIASVDSDQTCPSLLHFSNEADEQDVEVGRYEGSVHYEVDAEEVWGTENAFGLAQRVLVGVVHAPGKVPELRLNGIFMASGAFKTLPVVTARANNFIGRSLHPECEPFHGRIGEIIVYSRAVDGAERESIQRYLQTKWRYEPPVKTKPGPGEIGAL